MSLKRRHVLSSWPRVAPLLSAALANSGDTVEDLFKACLRGDAILLESETLVTVVRPQPRGDGEHDLVVWAVCARPGQTADLVSAEHDLVCAARTSGARALVFLASAERAGFRRIMGPGWTVRNYVMERRV